MNPHGEDWAAGLFDDDPADRPGPEPLDEGGTHLLDLVAAVDYLNRGIRPDFTVWDALEEALTWWLTDHTDQPIDIPESGLDDPSATASPNSSTTPQPAKTAPSLTPSNRPSATGPPSPPTASTTATTGPTPSAAGPSHPAGWPPHPPDVSALVPWPAGGRGAVAVAADTGVKPLRGRAHLTVG